MNRPYKEFRDAWLGKCIDYDNCYKYQCIDLIKLYLDKCLGYGKIGSLGNAKDVPNNRFFDGWAKITLTTSNAKQWDIVVANKGTYWHVAIVDRVVNGQLVVLEQNGTGKNSGSGKDGNEIRIKAYDFGFFNMILRNTEVVKNFNQERDFVLNKVKETKADLDNTIDYYRAIQWGSGV